MFKKIKQLNNEIEQLKNERNKLLNNVLSLQTENKELIQKLYNISNELSTQKIEYEPIIKEKEEYLKTLQSQIDHIESNNYIQTLGMYDVKNDSKYYKEEFNTNRSKQKEMLSNKTYYTVKDNWYINGNAKEGNRLIEFFTKICITSFNLMSDNTLDKVNIINNQYIKDKVKRVFNTYNKELSSHSIELSNDYLLLKLDEIQIRLDIYIAKENEKEEESKRKEILREQAKAEKELQDSKNKLEKELLHYQLQLNKGSDVQDKIDEIQARIDTDDYMLSNTRAGYVYIVNNPSLGKDVYKIGITRRMDGCEGRLKELSGSNIPFVFNPNCIMWSDDCFKLESELHHEFDKYRVNPIKRHREFFKLPLSEIEKVVKEKYCKDAIFDYDIIDEDFIASGYKICENFLTNDNDGSIM